MEFHPPAGPIHSLKDFFLHLGIVTIGILIALGLEQLVERHHRAKVADVAVEGFRREITDDMDEVKGVLDAVPELRAQVRDSIAALSGASWDTALATQALGYLPYDSVKRYAGAYGVLHLFLEQETHAVYGRTCGASEMTPRC
jgi:hypothetical protein